MLVNSFSVTIYYLHNFFFFKCFFSPSLSHSSPDNSEYFPGFASEMALSSISPATEWFGFREGNIRVALHCGGIVFNS